MQERSRADMTTENEQDRKKPLQLSGRLELKKSVDSGQVRQQVPHGRQKTVQVEIKRKRSIASGGKAPDAPTAAATSTKPAPAQAVAGSQPTNTASADAKKTSTAPEAKAAAQPEKKADAQGTASKSTPVEAKAPAQSEAKASPANKAPGKDTPKKPDQANAGKDGAASSGKAASGKASGGRGDQKNNQQGRSQGASGKSRRGGRGQSGRGGSGGSNDGGLTNNERQARAKALQDALREQQERRRMEVEEAARRKAEEEERKKREAEEAVERAKAAEEEAKRKAEEEAEAEVKAKAEPKAVPRPKPKAEPKPDPIAEVMPPIGPKAIPEVAGPSGGKRTHADRSSASHDDEPASKGRKGKKGANTAAVPSPSRRGGEERRRSSKLNINQMLDDEEGQRIRSLASVRRQREREKQRLLREQAEQTKISREVVIPETITVQELANRMAERGANVIKSLMKMGVMATINQVVDADTAELVVEDFGHKAKRVSDADVEIGLGGIEDDEAQMEARPPVVTIMGHVDHGKTSLLDALRETDVVGGEAGGITQHIGAYQVTMNSGKKITFIDTPGHAAFSEMRARGANVTDIVVLVVAADDGIKQQTVEALHHAKAAEVPIIVAINKIDKPGADPNRVRQELLNHDIQVEAMGGEVLDVEVSAKKRQNLDKLEEAIVLQAELMDLKANPDRGAEGVIVEAKMERGRGSVATVLVQRGTLRVGDIFVAGQEWGRVRAMIDDHGNREVEAGPSRPVEVLGLNGTPAAGDDYVVVEDEGRAREIASYRQRLERDKAVALAAGKRGSLEQMFDRIKAGDQKELPIIIKGDVQGSVEAIVSSLEKLTTDEVKVKVLHAAVGGINESDITLAKASEGAVIGFNVRANPQARDLARRENITIEYYSIIYNLIEDIKGLLSGMLAPQIRETFIGNAEVREVFNITKVGKVAGTYITEGHVARGAKVRLLRDNVVIHEGKLKTLRRFKDEVKEVQQGYECGMAFENYQDLQPADVIECFIEEEIARVL